MLMIQPPPRCFSAGIAAFVHRNTPVRLVAIMRCQSSTFMSATLANVATPALLMSESRPPKRSTAVLTICVGYGRVGDVSLHHRDVGAEFGDHGVEVGLERPEIDDLAAAGHEATRDGQADPPRTAGDDGDVPVELRLGSHAPYTTGVARRLPRLTLMPFVAILGAGPLGGALAYALASRGRFDEVRLIDPEKTLAAGKALDILQSGPVDGCSTRVTGSASLDEADGAWVAILADPVQPDPLTHLAALHRRSPGAIVVCADAGTWRGDVARRRDGGRRARPPRRRRSARRGECGTRPDRARRGSQPGTDPGRRQRRDRHRAPAASTGPGRPSTVSPPIPHCHANDSVDSISVSRPRCRQARSRWPPQPPRWPRRHGSAPGRPFPAGG